MTHENYYGYAKEVHERALFYIERYILMNQNYLITELLKVPTEIAGISFDNISNLYNDEDEFQEILEWWLVDQWLAEELISMREPVLMSDDGAYWGRTCSGQAIILDGTMQKIAQKYL